MDKKPHKHAKFIKAKADGETIQEMNPRRAIGEWNDMAADDWDFAEGREYRIKPEPPKYPQTSLTASELVKLYEEAPTTCIHDAECFSEDLISAYFAIANAAIARSIEDGQVVTMEQHTKEMGEACLLGNDTGRIGMVPAAMLEKVAEAACRATYNAVRSVNYNIAYGDLKLDLAAIIASVKEGK